MNRWFSGARAYASRAGATAARWSSSTAASRACSECGAVAVATDHIFCGSCPAVLEPAPPLMSTAEGAVATEPLFDLFDLGAPCFALDLALLTERYRGLQKRLHPDVFSRASDAQIDAALKQSARVNDAYGELQRPYSRARHLLATRGVALDGEETLMDNPELLMHVMDVREDLECARGGGNDAAVETIGLENRAAMDAVIDELADLFDSVGEEGCDLNAARRATTRLRYLTTIHNEVYSLVDADA